MVKIGKEKKESLVQRVLSFILQENLISRGETVVVGVSGGPDSVCLLHILVQLQPQLDCQLYIAHLNHQLRGAESEADARYVTDLACHLGIPVIIESRDVAGYQQQHHCSLEEAAREVRYSYFSEVTQSTGASCVAVGHTTEDHIETILMHLIRGTGNKGLRGLQSGVTLRIVTDNTDLEVIRPLLEIGREETVDYCTQCKLMPRIDSTNSSMSLLRNRIRHELLPLLRTYNSRIDRVLHRTASLAGDDFTFLEREAASLWGVIAEEKRGAILFDKKQMSVLPPALQRQLLRQALEQLLGSSRDIEAVHIEAMRFALDKPAGKRLSLPGGLFFSTEYEKCLLGPDPASCCPFPVIEGEHPIKVPGETIASDWRIKATIIKDNFTPQTGDNFKAYLDLDKAGRQLMLRARRPGDRFQPLGMHQLKKLQDFMVDARIPRAWRERVPLVYCGQQILWVVGWRIDDRVKVTETTEQVIQLEFEKMSR